MYLSLKEIASLTVALNMVKWQLSVKRLIKLIPGLLPVLLSGAY